MIEADKRNAVYLMHQQGNTLRDISRRLHLNRHTIRCIIRQEGKMPSSQRKELHFLEPELLRLLYKRCDGWGQRIHEILEQEYSVEIPYSSLMRKLRTMGISDPPKSRCERVPDQPGAEMQHDTSLYRIEIGGQRVRLIASVLYLRYSKRRYLKFYRSFNRFKMKCFLHEALMFWGHSARLCVIDNTNLARLRGSGSNAVIVAEMEKFAQQYGFQFLCHAIGHANRKAGEERSFYTVESNFIAGRYFQSLEDLNAQALEWATVQMEHRPQGKARLIPAKAFESECLDLLELPGHLPAPYQSFMRQTDQYGYISFQGNFYWVPGTARDEVSVLEYSERIQIYRHREKLIEYLLPADGVKNAITSPEGQPKSRYKPNNRKKSTLHEEQTLRKMGPAVNAYMDFVLETKGIIRNCFVRELYTLSRQTTASLLRQTVERALYFRITSIKTCRRIAMLYINHDELSATALDVDFDSAFQERQTYREGQWTDPPDFSSYDKLLEDNDE